MRTYCRKIIFLGFLGFCVSNVLPENRFTTLAQQHSSVDQASKEVSALFQKKFKSASGYGNRVQMYELAVEFNQYIDMVIADSQSVIDTVMQDYQAVLDEKTAIVATEQLKARLRKSMCILENKRAYLKNARQKLNAKKLVDDPDLLSGFISNFSMLGSSITSLEKEIKQCAEYVAALGQTGTVQEEESMGQAIASGLKEGVIEGLKESAIKIGIIAVCCVVLIVLKSGR